MTAPPRTSKRRFAAVAGIMMLIFAGISSFHYRDMMKPVPGLASLRKIPADGLRYEGGESRSGSRHGFEFFDGGGMRYQTKYLDRDEARAIDEGLRQGGVVLWVGEWHPALKSDSIFTIYHMTQGERVLLDYHTITAAKQKEQKAAIPVLILSGLVVAGILGWLYKKQVQE